MRSVVLSRSVVVQYSWCEIQGVPKKITSFRRPIILEILIEITSNLNRLRFYTECFIFDLFSG